jgi:hypothetical protein
MICFLRLIRMILLDLKLSYMNCFSTSLRFTILLQLLATFLVFSLQLSISYFKTIIFYCKAATSLRRLISYFLIVMMFLSRVLDFSLHWLILNLMLMLVVFFFWSSCWSSMVNFLQDSNFLECSSDFWMVWLVCLTQSYYTLMTVFWQDASLIVIAFSST